MPGVYQPNNLASLFRQVFQRLRGVETQQQFTFSNSKGLPLITTGMQPGSNPPQYGFKFWNPTAGQPLAFFGEDTTGAVGLYYYNTSGEKVSQYDPEGLHFYDTSGNEVVRLDSTGLHVYNSSGTEEVAAGLISPSPAMYGLAVLPQGGTTVQMVGGQIGVTTPLETSVTSNGVWTNFPSPSSITCNIGPSGQATISVSAYVGTAGLNEAGSVGVLIDGTIYGTYAELSVAASGGVAGILGSASALPPGHLTAGSHTFQLAYMTGASAETFQATMTVQPL